MNKYLIVLMAPSMHFMNEKDYYKKAYVVEATADKISNYVDEKLMRLFALDFKIDVSQVRILAAAQIK